MIRADMTQIEALTDLLGRVASDGSDALERLRRVSNEMQEDDELALYPQTPVVLETVAQAVTVLTRADDTLQSLHTAMMPVATAYRDAEQRHKDALARMAERMGSLQVGYNAAIVSDKISPVESTQENRAMDTIAQMVADSVEEMQMTNIAAVTRTVREEYAVTAVETMTE